jgi:photosystem II PsbU protein
MKQVIKSVLARFILGCCIVALVLLGGPRAMRPAIAAPSPTIDDIGLCAVTEQSIDLNNANLLAFTDCPGFYPNLASVILTHGPYSAVDDVLSIPDLTDYQKSLLKGNLKAFTVSDPVVPLEQRMPPRLNQPAH